MAGTVFSVPPIPADPAHTTYVPAGALRIGIEWRHLDDSELEANYRGNEMKEIRAAVDAGVEDNGVSLHVVGEADGHEYLRFDLFEHGPHYHYIDRSGERQTIVDFDRVALGEMLPWALQQLRTRLPEMLEFAGGGDLTSKLEASAIEASLPEVHRLAVAAQAELQKLR